MPEVCEKSAPIPQGDAAVQIQLAPKQFQLLLETLQRSTSKFERANKWLDFALKIVITIGLSAFTAYISYREFAGKQTEFEAKSFADLFSANEETRLAAAAASVNELDNKTLEKFVRLTMDRFSDDEPKYQDYAQQGIVNMASTSYERRKKITLIVDALAEGLGKDQDVVTKKRAAYVAGRIGIPTSKLLNAASALLTNSNEASDSLVAVCSAIRTLEWVDSNASVESSDVLLLRKSLESVLQNAKQSGVHMACDEALQKLPHW